MMSGDEAQQIRHIVHQELADIETQVSRYAGSYNYLCACGGITMFSHKPIGKVLRQIHHCHE